MKKSIIWGAVFAAVVSAQAVASVGSDAQALLPAAQQIANPYQRGLAEGWLEVAQRQDSHVLLSKVHGDAASRALNNGRSFINGSGPFEPIYTKKNWPPADTRKKWFDTLQQIDRVNERALHSPCRGESAGRLSALTDEVWKEQDETHGTRWVHGWEAIERAQKLALQVDGELDKCVAPASPPAQAQVPARAIPTVSLAADALFDFDSATLLPEGHRQLQALAQQWQHAGVNLNLLTINGYTDRFGSAAHNLKLSQQRAIAVANALKDAGTRARRVEMKGLGAANPVKFCPGSKATPSVIACLAPNRRVEVVGE